MVAPKVPDAVKRLLLLLLLPVAFSACIVSVLSWLMATLWLTRKVFDFFFGG